MNTLLPSNKTLRDKQIDVLIDMGFRMIPIEANGKSPDSRLMTLRQWRRYINVPPTPHELETWKNSDCNFAALLGASSNAIVFDFDHQAFLYIYKFLRKLSPSLLKKVRIAVTGSGYHVYVFSNDRELLALARNKKLARSGTGVVTIESKGTGGYVCVPPSVHPSGIPYQWCSYTSGGTIVRMSGAEFLLSATDLDLRTLYVTKAELGELFDVAISLNAHNKVDRGGNTVSAMNVKNPILEPFVATNGDTDDDTFTVSEPPKQYVTNEVQKQIQALSNTRRGERNTLLFSTALYIGRVSHLLDEQVLTTYMNDLSTASVTNGMVKRADDREVYTTIRSGMRTGMGDPLNVVYVGDVIPFAFAQ